MSLSSIMGISVFTVVSADDAQIFRVLENSSAFLFESFLGRSKRMVREAHNVVQQIVPSHYSLRKNSMTVHLKVEQY